MTDPNMPPPGYTPPPGYAAPPPAYAPGQVARTNTLAIVALVLGIVVPIGGIICGHIALRQIRRTGEQGHGLALAGTIIGYVLTVLILLIVVANILFFVILFGTAATHIPTGLPSDFPS
ncbi:DUF4190 domain-containing protein [uncultured Amnibacterium sp.]|uniref:DUF4190 domain-containing protein n=1 Tax=uncultured Amnibacterium sp. TaxID=1631851 RepID=UPI0035CAE958